MKTAVVTGGASGIGLEFVKLLISDNYKVYVVDNSQENLSKLSSIVNSENFESILQDLSKTDSPEKLYKILKNSISLEKYRQRLNGLISSMRGKKSDLRLNN